MSAVVTVPTSWTREARMVYSVTGAEPMRLLGNMAVPYEIELVWLDGKLAAGAGTIRGHRLKNDGTVGRAVATGLVPRRELRPAWVVAILEAAAEPVGVDTEIVRLEREHRRAVAAYAEWCALGMGPFQVWQHRADGMPFELLYEVLPLLVHDRLKATIDQLQELASQHWAQIRKEFTAACRAIWFDAPRPSSVSPDELSRFRARTAGSPYSQLLVDLLYDRDIHNNVWLLIRPDTDVV